MFANIWFSHPLYYLWLHLTFFVKIEVAVNVFVKVKSHFTAEIQNSHEQLAHPYITTPKHCIFTPSSNSQSIHFQGVIRI